MSVKFAIFHILFHLVTDAMDCNVIGSLLQAAQLRHWWGVLAWCEAKGMRSEGQRSAGPAGCCELQLQNAAASLAAVMLIRSQPRLSCTGLFRQARTARTDDDRAQMLDLLDKLQQGACRTFGYESAERRTAALLHQRSLLETRARSSARHDDVEQPVWADLGVAGVHDEATADAASEEMLFESLPKWQRWIRRT